MNDINPHNYCVLVKLRPKVSAETETEHLAKISAEYSVCRRNKLCTGGRHNMPPPPVTLTFDLLTLKVVSQSRVTWATSVPILVFLGLSVLDLGPMYATDRQTSDRHTSDRRQTSDSITA